MCEARRPCFLTLAPCSQPGVPGGITKAAWPREPSSRSTEAITTWTLAMPPLVAQAFWPLSTHSSLASSYLAVVRIAETSEPASGSEAQKAAELDVVRRAEALRDPLPHLLRGSLPEDRGDRERGAHDRHADARRRPRRAPRWRSAASGRSRRPRTGPSLRSCRGRSWRPPGSPARASPRARPIPTAAGRTTPSAKPCTHSRMSFWSWLSSRVKTGSPCGFGTVPGDPAQDLVRVHLGNSCGLRHGASITRNDVVVSNRCRTQTSRRSKARRPSAPSSVQSKKRRLTQS